ncbi:MAG TPA: hypothetical protein VE968_04210 [Sphingomicrobium sp.]|nr:hypothetical protein [Sphingomicrobium sp.]
MKILLEKGIGADVVEIRRNDGTVLSTSVPHKGPVPHDAVHFFVESELAMRAGFWGLVAGGRHPDAIGELAKQAGHASATRARSPDTVIVPAIQAERIVECFEADLWGGGCDPQTFNEMLEAGCAQSLVEPIDLATEVIASVRNELQHFKSTWEQMAIGAQCALEWPDDWKA